MRKMHAHPKRRDDVREAVQMVLFLVVIVALLVLAPIFFPVPVGSH